MAEHGAVTSVHWDNLTENLERITGVVTDDIARTSTLDAAAARIRSTTPRSVDTAIRLATRDLMALATPEAEISHGRELLEGVLRINQYKPSHTIWSGPADIDGTLEQFDKLEEGAPALVTVSNVRGQVTGLVADKPVSVGISIARDMGGLPRADISFGFREVVIERGQTACLADDIETITINYDRLRHSIIGATAIQSYIDGSEMRFRTYPSGFCEVTNIGNLQYLTQEVSGLMAASGEVFDTTHIDEVIEKAKDLNASERRRATEEAGFRQRHNIPTLYR